MTDAWEGADAYESYVGRWSRLVAAELLGRLAVRPGARWLDVGCGTGALSAAVVEWAEPAELVGIDPSEPFLAEARRRVPGARFVAGDARSLPFGDGEFDAVVSGLVLNFVPEPDAAAGEIARVLRSGGIAAAYVWDYAEGMEPIRRFWDAATEVDAAAAELDEGRRFPLARPAPLSELFAEAGLGEVQVESIEIAIRFADFDDYWRPFLGGQGPAPGYAVSLDESRRAALRERLRTMLAPGDDGTIALAARAWAVRGSKA